VHCKLIAALLAVVIVFAPNVALAGGSQGGETTSDSSGGAPQISTWVIGAINGGVKRPAGTKTCTPWEALNGSTIELSNPNPIVIDPATGQPSTIYIRSCDGKFQYVYVGPHSPVDVAHVAYQKVAKGVRHVAGRLRGRGAEPGRLLPVPRPDATGGSRLRRLDR